MTRLPTLQPNSLTRAIQFGLSGLAFTLGVGHASSAQADFPSEVPLETLSTFSGYRIIANDESGRLGFFVSPAGDINGDGDADFIIGAPGGFFDGTSTLGRAYVVYGENSTPRQEIDLSYVVPEAFLEFIEQHTTIIGEVPEDGFGYAVSGAGDINGDGFDDLIIGALEAYGSDVGSGRVYIVFGQANGLGQQFDIGSLDGTNGFVIDGEQRNGALGHVVSQAGDINADGIDDLLIGARTFNGANGSSSGRVYVLFGTEDSFGASFGLSALDGNNGFYMDGEGLGDHFGFSINQAGDVNGDGIDDLIVGAIYAKTGEANNKTGRAYVVFGQATSFGSSLDVGALDGSNGFVMDGLGADDELGISVGSAGDINGDGFSDVVVGAVYNDVNGTRSGQAYVVFGKNTAFGASVDLAALDGTNGFILNGTQANDQFGWVSTGSGDVNGDGFDDVLVGARSVVVSGRYTGRAYVVFGQANGFSSPLEVGHLSGEEGFVINGTYDGGRIGRFLAFVGDINLDEVDDIVLGTPYDQDGRAYVVFGGVEGPGLTETPKISASSITFAEIPYGEPSEPQQITITDEGSLMALTTGQLTFAGSNPNGFELVDDNCSWRKLSSGSICTFSVRVRGTDFGPLAAELVIPSNGLESPLIVTLSGSVQVPTGADKFIFQDGFQVLEGSN